MGNSQITNKGKNLDMSTFYAFLILEDKDLKFVSRSLQAGVGAGAGLGTVGGGASAAVSNRKRDITDAAFLQLETATNRLSDLSAHSARLFSPSPTFAGETDNSTGSAGAESVSYVSAKESKVVVERKLLCIKEQTQHYKYVLASDVYDDEEKKKAKKGLDDIMVQLQELSK